MIDSVRSGFQSISKMADQYQSFYFGTGFLLQFIKIAKDSKWRGEDIFILLQSNHGNVR